MKVEVESNISDGMQRTLDEVLARATNMLPYYEVQARMLDALIMVESLAMRRDVFGKRFTELADSTVALRRKGNKSGSPTPLVDTGTMRGGIYVKAAKEWIEFGVSGAGAVYAGTHVFGRAKRPTGPFGGAAIPARAFLPASNKSGTRKADFSKGPAKEWYDAMISGLKVWMAEGKTSG